jgi:hypothetical protein
MAREFDPRDIVKWLEAQITATQINWMDHFEAGNEELRRQQEVVLDGIYAFREYFLEIPAPAPGQGYEPSEAIWAEVLKQRKLAAIDAKISELTAQREAITGPQPRLRRGEAVITVVSSVVADGELTV